MTPTVGARHREVAGPTYGYGVVVLSVKVSVLL